MTLRKKTLTSLALWFLVLPCAYAQDKTTVIPDVSLKPKKTTSKKIEERMQTTHVSREQIEETPVVNLTELLGQEQSIVRVTNNSSDPSQTALSIRGFGDNAVANSLILVDGFPLTNPSLLAPNFNAIPLSDIERVDIFQGSEGALWGDQAVGGVVNIITRHPKKWVVDSIIGAGSFNNTYFSLLAANKFENNVFLKAYGFASKNDNYREHNKQTSNNVAAQTGLDYAKGSISLYLQTYNDTVNFPGGLTLQQFNSNPRQATNAKQFSHYQTQWIRLLSKHAFNEDWLLETRLSYHQTDGNGFILWDFTRDDSQWFFNPRLIGKIYGSKTTFGYSSQGSRYQLQNIKVHTRTQSTQNNFYVQTIIPLTSTFDFTLGGRFAWQNNDAEKMVGQPSVDSTNRVFVTEQGLAYRPNDSWTLFLRRDGNFSLPKANEITFVPLNKTSLQAQTGTSYETGLERRTERQRSQVSLYRLALNNEIAFDPTQTATQPFGSFNNMDKTLRHGITLTEYYRLTRKFSLDSQLNYVSARFAGGPYNGNTVPAVPAFTGNANFNYALTSTWHAKYGLLYTGTRYASDDVANVGKRVPAYWLNNATLQYFIKPVDMSFEVINLFNVQYSAFTTYNSFTKANTYYPGAGRSYLFTIKANLD